MTMLVCCLFMYLVTISYLFNGYVFLRFIKYIHEKKGPSLRFEDIIPDECY